MFKHPGNLKSAAAASFHKQAELYPYEYRSESPTSSNFTFNRLSTLNVKVLTICLGLWFLC